jgi:hypothetical protein
MKADKTKEAVFISPQAKVIANLFSQCQYKFFKETGRLKKKTSDLEKVVIIKTSSESPKVQSPKSPVPVKASANSNRKSLTTKLKGSIEKLGSSSNVKLSAGSLNRSILQMGRSMTGRLNMKEEEVPLNTAKVKISSTLLDGMIPSAALPKGYKEGSYHITSPNKKATSPLSAKETTPESALSAKETTPESPKVQADPPLQEVDKKVSYISYDRLLLKCENL